MSSSSASLNTELAPSFSLVAWQMLLGVIGFVATGVVLVIVMPQLQGHWFNPLILGWVHTAALFWLLPIAMGSLHQMVPVLFEQQIYSEKIAWSALVLHVLGASGLVAHMFTLQTTVGVMATGLMAALALLMWVGNLLMTIRRARKLNLIGAHVSIALVFLSLAAVVGAILAWNMWDPWLPYDHLRWLRGHAHLAAFGFFGLLIMGVGYKLAEMFLLAYGTEMNFAKMSLIASSVGLTALAGVLMFSYQAPIIGGVLMVIGSISFLIQFYLILKKRMKRHLEVPWQHTISTLVWLVVACGFGIALLFDLFPENIVTRATSIYFFIVLAGFVGSVVSGQMFKIMPFLVWLKWYSPLLGITQIPPATELVSPITMRLQFVLQQGGVLAVVIGALIQQWEICSIGAYLFCASTLVFAFQMSFLMLSRPTPATSNKQND